MTRVAGTMRGIVEMIRTIPLVCTALVLSGCASLSYPLAKCDGYSPRPLNRALWQWEENIDLKQEHSDAGRAAVQSIVAAYTEEVTPAQAFTNLAIDTSYQPCKG